MFNSPQFVMLQVYRMHGGLQEQHFTAQHNLEIEIEKKQQRIFPRSKGCYRVSVRCMYVNFIFKNNKKKLFIHFGIYVSTPLFHFKAYFCMLQT